ncbi:ferrous iron transporter B [Flexivirga lutea]
MSHCSPGDTLVDATPGTTRIALLGSPNSGKTTLFNALTGLRAKTGNYPGVTVARYEGTARTPGGDVTIEDLPGTYSLDPISPDEQVVADVLDAADDQLNTPDALLVLVDATTIERSLTLVGQALNTGIPVTVVVTFGDELHRRMGSLDTAALQRALGVPVLEVSAGDKEALAGLRDQLALAAQWAVPVLPPPTERQQARAWARSVLDGARHRPPSDDARTRRLDAVLLHPILGTLIFAATMFLFFQVIFTLATPLQDLVQSWFDDAGGWTHTHLGDGWLGSFIGDALIGGVGSVMVFVPQIALLFLMIAILEGSGYLSRAAFLMDRLMARAGLEGRAFVALLSAWACAIPGIMATRSLPSARDRIATMMGAPLMTCSARLTVYVLLVGLLVPSSATVGPFGAQGVVMFVLYLVGALAAMGTAWVFKRITGRHGAVLPFYMEMPSYRLPRLRSVAFAVWDSSKAFLQKVGRIILVVTIVLWLLLNLPTRGTAEMQHAGVDTTSSSATSAYVLDHSIAAQVGRGVEPVFEPLGFDWRVNVGVLASLSAREVFVATLGQVAAAENPESPKTTLQHMTTERNGHQEKLFDAPTTAALLTFFLFALQCMSTIGVMRRETGTWRWPAIAFGYMFVLAWSAALLVHTVVAAIS